MKLTGYEVYSKHAKWLNIQKWGVFMNRPMAEQCAADLAKNLDVVEAHIEQVEFEEKIPPDSQANP